jgi:hypothetical protein
VRRRALHGFGLALMLASPLWLTLQEHANYFNFGISLALGICLLVLAGYFPEEKKKGD